METHEKLQRAIDRLTQARSFLKSAEAMIHDAGAALADDERCREEAARLTSELCLTRASTEELMKHVSSGCEEA